MKYRKKPVVVEAIQLTHDLALQCLKTHGPFFGPLYVSGSYREDKLIDAYVVIQTLEGTMRAELGDFIIRGVKGEYYPCKPDIFRAIYEPAE